MLTYIQPVLKIFSTIFFYEALENFKLNMLKEGYTSISISITLESINKYLDNIIKEEAAKPCFMLSNDEGISKQMLHYISRECGPSGHKEIVSNFEEINKDFREVFLKSLPSNLKFCIDNDVAYMWHDIFMDDIGCTYGFIPTTSKSGLYFNQCPSATEEISKHIANKYFRSSLEKYNQNHIKYSLSHEAYEECFLSKHPENISQALYSSLKYYFADDI